MTLPMLTPDEDDYWVWPDGSPILWGEEFQMSYKLFDLTYRVAQALGIVQESVATSGTVNTVVDTNARVEEDDYWNKGTLWVLRDAGGAGAAPEGEYAIVSDFDQSDETLTLQSSLTAAVAAGDRYAVARRAVPVGVIEQKINNAIMDLGIVPVVDTTTLTTADSQTEYTLPIAAKQDLRRVYIQTKLNASDNQWVEIPHDKEYTTQGNPDKIILHEQFTSGYALKLVYMANHPMLLVATATLSEYIPIELIIHPAIRDCWQYLGDHNRTREYDGNIATWERKVNETKQTFKIVSPSVRGRILTIADDGTYYPGDRNPR